MKTDVIMPKLGESITEGTIVKWHKAVGDTIKQEEILLEISTDKVDSEIPSPVAGVLAEILVPEGETVDVGTVIATVETDSGSAIAPTKAAGGEPKPPQPTVSKTPVSKPAGPIILDQPQAGRFYSPLVLTIAAKEGVTNDELNRVAGSGRGGRVSKRDILAYIDHRKAVPAPSPEPSPIARSGGNPAGVPMDSIRQKVAAHMRASLDTSAHAYAVMDVDVSRLMKLVQQERPAFLAKEGFKLTVGHFIAHAVARTLADIPEINVSVHGANIVQHKNAHVGIATATERGLLVPVIKSADEKSFLGIARVANELVQRTRSKQITPDDVSGSTFTITNYGVFGQLMGLPIINQPNVAILGVGAFKKQPVVIESNGEDTIAIRTITLLTLGFDHRVIDGDIASKFLNTVKSYLENPDLG
jgi:pyruvate dehydrogenase E2 component (dihydrolipoamide acetyltransferase)